MNTTNMILQVSVVETKTSYTERIVYLYDNCICLNQCLITYRTQKMKSITIFIMKTNDSSLSKMAQKIIGLKLGCNELDLESSKHCTDKLFVDNTLWLNLTDNSIAHGRSKQIETHFYHF